MGHLWLISYWLVFRLAGFFVKQPNYLALAVIYVNF
jgi:hypothetical protein